MIRNEPLYKVELSILLILLLLVFEVLIMEKLSKRSFNINLKVMEFLYLYTSKKTTSLYKARAYIVYLLFSLHVPIFGILYVIFEKNINFKDTGDNTFILAEVTCCIFKLLPFITKCDRIRNLINYLDSPVFNNNLKEQQLSIVNMYVSICRRNTKIFLSLVLSAFILWVVRPFFWADSRLPTDVWLPSNISAKPTFYCIYLYVVLGAGYPALASAVTDPLIGGLASLIVAQLKVLKNDLQYLQEHVEEEFDQKLKPVSSQAIFEKSDMTYCKIKQYIKYHNAILYFVKEYEECFSSIAFYQLLGSIFVLCLCCFQLNMLKPMSLGFLQAIICLVLFVTQIYFYCYYGTLLVEEGNTLTTSIYMSNWYEYDIKSRKCLITFMERSKKPMKVTAGKVLDLSLETFSTILKRSYSLLAVLKNQ